MTRSGTSFLKRNAAAPGPGLRAPARAEWLAFWLILGASLAIRLVAITQPFVDCWAWRESDVAMIAENLHHHGYNLFYPQVNWGGSGPGYVGTEFPLLPWIAAWLYNLFGVQEWVGRMLCVASFGLSVPAVYLLTRRMLQSGAAALFAVALYALTPLSIFAARSFMPDTPALAFSLWGLLLFAWWVDQPRRHGVFAGAVLATALALLVKIPMLALAPVLLAVGLQARGWRFFRLPLVWVFVAASLLPAFFWYRHALYVGKTFSPFHTFGDDGIRLEPLAYYGTAAAKAWRESFTPLLCMTAFAGLGMAIWRRSWALLAWLAAMVLFFFVAGRGNRHAWYQLPTAPVLCMFAALPLAWIWERLRGPSWKKRLRVAVVGGYFAALAYVSFEAVKWLYEPYYAYVLPTADAVKKFTPPDALVVAIVAEKEPVLFYYQQRRGWLLPTAGKTGLADDKLPADSAAAIAELERRRAEGATHLVITEKALWWLDYYQEFRAHLDGHYHRVAQTSQYVIFDLH